MSKFKSPDALEEVSKFHELFEHPVLANPIIPDEKRCKLRISLLKEELKELEEAIENKDIVEVADALADIQYVLSGAVLEFGLGSRFKALFDEVQRSNMSKACLSEQEAKDTQDHYAKQGVESYVRPKDGVFLVFRKEDNKLLKSLYYSPADLASIVNKSENE